MNYWMVNSLDKTKDQHKRGYSGINEVPKLYLASFSYDYVLILDFLHGSPIQYDFINITRKRQMKDQ